MNAKQTKILDMILPSNIVNNTVLLNDIYLFNNSEQEETQEFYKVKILNQMSDTDLISIYVLYYILTKYDKLLLNAAGRHSIKFFNLIRNNIIGEIGDMGDIDFIKQFIIGFDFNNYTDNISSKAKYGVHFLNDKKVLLVLDNEYIKYLAYLVFNNISINLVINIFKNINIDIYNTSIKHSLETEFYTSDVPGEQNKQVELLNTFFKYILQNKILRLV